MNERDMPWWMVVIGLLVLPIIFVFVGISNILKRKMSEARKKLWEQKRNEK